MSEDTTKCSPYNYVRLEGVLKERVMRWEYEKGVKVMVMLQVFKPEGTRHHNPTIDLVAWDEMGSTLEAHAGKAVWVEAELRRYKSPKDQVWKTELDVRAIGLSELDSEDQYRSSPWKDKEKRPGLSREEVEKKQAARNEEVAATHVPQEDDFPF